MTKAVNAGKRPNWLDPNKEKWLHWLRIDPSAPSGFVFGGADFRCSNAYAGNASRLCSIDEKRALHLAEIAHEAHVGILTK